MHTNFDIVLFDISNIAYRSFFTTTELNKNGEDIGMIKTSLLTLQSIIKRHSPKKVVIVFDGKGGSKYKKKIFSEYKGQRSFPAKLNVFPGSQDEQEKKSKDNFLWQLKILFELCSYLPVYNAIRAGFEADELVAYLCQVYFKDNKKLIVSNDKDYHQLMNDKCYIYNLDLRNVIHYEYLKKKWETENTKNLTVIRTMVGDASDNIYGIDGLGVKKIKNYFPELFDSGLVLESIDDFKLYLNKKMDDINGLEKKQSKDKTTIQKIKHLLNEHDGKHTDKKCIDILERNYELMQLFNIEMDASDMQFIDRVMNAKIPFDKNEIDKIVKSNCLEEINNSFTFWETFGREASMRNRVWA